MRDLSQVPDYVLEYLAPMACGSAERAELCRRRQVSEKHSAAEQTAEKGLPAIREKTFQKKGGIVD